MSFVNDRIDLFLENRTYTFIRLNSGKLFNGYILNKNRNKKDIEFKDDMLGKIPIIIKEIDIIDYSTKHKKRDEK